MPSSGDILLSCRHDIHFRTTIYQNGHVVECGVFEPGTAYQGRIERYSVLLERGGIAALAQNVRDEARRIRREHLFSPQNLPNLALLLWSYHQEMERGEWLAAHRNLSPAVDLLLDLLAEYVLPEDEKRGSLLDPRRRLEQLHPELAAELRSVLKTADRTSGAALLRLAERELRKEAPELEWDAVETVRSWMEAPG